MGTPSLKDGIRCVGHCPVPVDSDSDGEQEKDKGSSSTNTFKEEAKSATKKNDGE